MKNLFIDSKHNRNNYAIKPIQVNTSKRSNCFNTTMNWIYKVNPNKIIINSKRGKSRNEK